MNYWLISVIFLLVSALIVSLYYNYRFGKIILQVQDDIEECLDVLDVRYKSISEILNIPVFFDSIEVRNVINEIRKSRDAVLMVANRLISIDRPRENIEDEEGKEESYQEISQKII